MSIVSVSQPCAAIVSAAKLFGIASQPLTTGVPAFHIVRRRFSLIGMLRRVGRIVTDRDLAFDLDRDIERQLGHADRAARMRADLGAEQSMIKFEKPLMTVGCWLNPARN
jgi:hypothetical protein